MNKNRVNNWILPAKKALEDLEIVKNGEIDFAFRSHISSFGAAIVMGSLPAAVAFFSQQNNAAVERNKLLKAMYYCITGKMTSEMEILQYVCENNSYELCEKFTDASIAVKLAINFFTKKEK